jgi:hypothetical protein
MNLSREPYFARTSSSMCSRTDRRALRRKLLNLTQLTEQAFVGGRLFRAHDLAAESDRR